MYRQFNIKRSYVLPTQCIYVFCVDLRTNNHYFPIQHQLTGFYNLDGMCLLRGTDWMFFTWSAIKGRVGRVQSRTQSTCVLGWKMWRCDGSLSHY